MTKTRLNEADLYAYGVRLGVQLLGDRRWKHGLRHLIQPVPYWRSLEYRLVWSQADFRPGDHILDIGSPKLLSIYLAERVGAEVFSTDIDGYFVDEYCFLRTARAIPEDRLRIEMQDGRKLSYADESFDKVYSISVIEHIPDHGDSECLREIGRVLRPGGLALITVPFSPSYKEDWRAPTFYWSNSSTSAPDGRVFYQRRYGMADLEERLIEPSGLRVKTLQFVGERIMIHARREFSELLTPVTAPLDPLLSRLVHTPPEESPSKLKKPLCAFLCLTKM